ncbi:NAD(P)/FAD-dependent oxidoreductase [Streptomyces sp. NBC_00338]|uniref:NAD(P)/FAD-dependent oxidoreductase n=1 Tax=Streptomyces sp. NBC_00338 TaxID=2975715 RepID=UPI0022503B26|nr:FAD-dependent oxidoreductase [Streptomyces sp. NBC_00338]MCX5144485.1 NAD(P)/FAD-dependent oxidoreductase [Streptomyces sp. NBC_00338]
MTRRERSVDVLVVGAGPAGLGAAAALAASGVRRVEVLEREQTAGGIPRHCHHKGFGSRRTSGGISGPEYARRSAAAATGAGAVLRTGITVTGWAGPRILDTTGPGGLERITARAVVLATGARERPRSARLVPGTRPAGVYTTGELQQAVHLHHQHIGSRAVIVGDEPVADAAAGTLREAGVEVVARVTDRPPVRPAALEQLHSAPLLTRTAVTALTGRTRLTGVSVRHEDGRTTTLPCDTVVFTGDWIPEHELARRAGLPLDPGTRGPAHDAAYRTGEPGVFAVGNVLHGVESAGTAAAEGRALAVPVLRHLATGDWPADRPAVAVAAPLEWITPNLIGPGDDRPLGDRFILRTGRILTAPLLVVRQDGVELHRRRLLRPARPGRPFHLPAGWLDRADPHGGTVHVSLD